MKTYVIYHDRDLDGECSAAIVYYCLSGQYNRLPAATDNEIIFCGMDYGRPNPLPATDYMHPDDHIYIVDFSFNLEIMRAYNSVCKLTWIDHHTSRLQEAEEAGFIANSGQMLAHDVPAACELTWQFFNAETPPPPAVKLLSDYDCWQAREGRAWNGTILPFQLGMSMEYTIPPSQLWPRLLEENDRHDGQCARILSVGDMLYDYRTRERESLKRQATPCVWRIDGEKYLCLCLNSLDLRADFWDQMLDDEERAAYDLLINYGYDGDPAWRVTLSPADRESGPDCSAIAKANGGGGHAGRAGFCTAFPPFLPTHETVDPT